MPPPLPELTEAEWVIIKAVWTHQPCAAPTIQEALAGSQGWAYSTVRTLMDRMASKGLLTTEKVRHLTLYRAAITRQQAQLGELRYALRHAFDGALKPMVETLISNEKLSVEELDELESMIKNRRQLGETGKRPRKAKS
ncbi:MAG: BlaI/MecI/CopY family transcriptional regulator [Verrucomicrobiales bacterium]|nr:BlaI/MecI/CopY family transcriptional regulator [Verrucomicrobiales bacterium]